MLNLSLVRLLEVIGEAANRVTTETRQQYPNIAWPQIVGLRNRLIHGYDTIDFDILWNTLQDDLPTLIGQLKSISSDDRPTDRNMDD